MEQTREGITPRLKSSITNQVYISLTTWTALTLLVGYLSLKIPKVRILLDGEPTIVIKKGKILEKAMSAMHLNMDDLTMLLREKDVFSITEVEYAILEPHGRISILKKAENEHITKKDLNFRLVR